MGKIGRLRIPKSEQLKSNLKALDETVPVQDRIRLHRAISWLKCSEELDVPDISFITLWIAFNACYADSNLQDEILSERKRFSEFVEKLVESDEKGNFYNLLWHNFSGPVRQLLDNRYAYKLFWDAQKRIEVDWKRNFENSKKSSVYYLHNDKVAKLLELVLDRMYTVRNQLMHGGATFQSQVNRSQVRDACNMMAHFVPVVIDIMIKHINLDWGEINYPVIEDEE